MTGSKGQRGNCSKKSSNNPKLRYNRSLPVMPVLMRIERMGNMYKSMENILTEHGLVTNNVRRLSPILDDLHRQLCKFDSRQLQIIKDTGLLNIINAWAKEQHLRQL